MSLATTRRGKNTVAIGKENSHSDLDVYGYSQSYRQCNFEPVNGIEADCKQLKWPHEAA